MRLTYRILWFENEAEFVDETKPGIASYLLDDLGLELEVDVHPSGDDVDALLTSGDYDLVVTDLNLDDNDTGKAIIERIRADEILTEVLLYSADGQEIEKVIKETSGLQRVSFAVGRAALSDRLKKIITLTVKKVQDVQNLRGLVIAEAIDLEDKMLEIINAHFSASTDDAEKGDFIKYHYGKKDEHFKGLLSKISGHTPDKIIEFVEIACGEMMSKYIALNKLIDSAKAKQDVSTNEGKAKMVVLKQLEAELNKMQKEVIELRNDLAHVQGEKDAQGRWILKNKKKPGHEIVFDNDKYVQIRRSLRAHAYNLTEIAKHLP